MTTKIYASYGSNMNIRDMSVTALAARLIGIHYAIDFAMMMSGWPIIVSMDGSTKQTDEGDGPFFCPMAMWEITEDCEERLDGYEGYPFLYDKTILPYKYVLSPRNVTNPKKYEEGEALIYLMKPENIVTPLGGNSRAYEATEQGYLECDVSLTYYQQSMRLMEILNDRNDWNQKAYDAWFHKVITPDKKATGTDG